MKRYLVIVALWSVVSAVFADEMITVRSREVGAEKMRLYQKGAVLVPANETQTNSGTAKWIASRPEDLMENARLVAFHAEVPWEKPYQNLFREVEMDGIGEWKSIELFWPVTDLNAKPPELQGVKGFPRKNQIWLVSSNGLPLPDCEVSVAYNSSRRKDSYLSDAKGIVTLDRSNVENSWKVSIRFTNHVFTMLLSSRQSWDNGVIVVCPVVVASDKPR